MENTRTRLWIMFGLCALFILVITLLLAGSGPDPQRAVRALETQGYRNVRITYYRWFMVSSRGCNNTHAARFDAEATNPVGRRVTLFVCVGAAGHGSTIHTE